MQLRSGKEMVILYRWYSAVESTGITRVKWKGIEDYRFRDPVILENTEENDKVGNFFEEE